MGKSSRFERAHLRAARADDELVRTIEAAVGRPLAPKKPGLKPCSTQTTETPYSRLPLIASNSEAVPRFHADIKKEGSAFDLPLAVAILGGVGILHRQDMSDFLLVGELSLDGKLRPVRGVLSIAMLAREKKIPCLIVAPGNAREAAVVGGIEVHPMRTLTEVVNFLNGTRSPQPFCIEPQTTPNGQPPRGEDFRDVRGQFHAKRAIEVAMAGGHNVLMIWTLPCGRITRKLTGGTQRCFSVANPCSA